MNLLLPCEGTMLLILNAFYQFMSTVAFGHRCYYYPCYIDKGTLAQKL